LHVRELDQGLRQASEVAVAEEVVAVGAEVEEVDLAEVIAEDVEGVEVGEGEEAGVGVVAEQCLGQS